MDKHDKKVFNDPTFLSNVGSSLRNNPEATFELTFHGNSNNEVDAKQEFENECPGLVKLKKEFPDRVHIRWSPIRPRQHYTVVDQEKTVLEEPKHRPQKQPWMSIVLDEKMTKDWDGRFDEYAQYCHELSF